MISLARGRAIIEIRRKYSDRARLPFFFSLFFFFLFFRCVSAQITARVAVARAYYARRFHIRFVRHAWFMRVLFSERPANEATTESPRAGS